MKYTTMKNYRNRMRQILLLALFALAGGMEAVAQGTGTWTPPAAGGTFRLRSTGTGNNFNVYNEEGTSVVSSNRTKIYRRVILTGELTLIFENTKTIELDGQFDLNADGASVTLRLGDISEYPNIAHTADNPTLKVIGNSGYNSQKAVFFLRSKGYTDVNKQKVIIEGAAPGANSNENIDQFIYNWDNNFVIDGDGPVLTVDTVTQSLGASPLSPYVIASDNGSIKDYTMFRLQCGTLRMKNVTVQNFSNSWTYAGLCQVNTGTYDGVNLEFDHCYFTSIGAKASAGSPVLRMQGGGGTNANRNALIKKCEFKNTFGSYDLEIGQTVPVNNPNATIRTLGNNKTPLTIKRTHIWHNYGCPVRWHGCGSSKEMVIDSCLIDHNFTKIDDEAASRQVYGGGGLLLKGPAIITNCEIHHNRTDGNGGGIYLSTYVDFNTGTYNLIPEHSILRLDPNTKIHHNIAKEDGGGVAIEAQLMKNPYYTGGNYLTNTNGYIYWNYSLEPFKVRFVQNGGEVYNNTALGASSSSTGGGYGGGVLITRPANAPFYKVECVLDFGKIYNNKASNDGTAGHGGGVAIKTGPIFDQHDNNGASFTPPNNVMPQDITVEVGDPYADSTITVQQMQVNANESNMGGGIYVEAYPIPLNNVTSKVEVTAYASAKIYQNNANADGGGIFLETGTMRINGGTIRNNNANGDGGGIYVHSDGIVTTDVKPHAEQGGGGGGGGGGASQTEIPEAYQDQYKQLEWITANGTQYINTGIQSVPDQTIYVDFAKFIGVGYGLFGGNDYSFSNFINYKETHRGIRMNVQYFQYYWTNNTNYNDTVYFDTIGIDPKQRFRYAMNKTRLVVLRDDHSVAYHKSYSSPDDKYTDWYLFKGRNNDGCYGTLYRAKIWSGATLNADGTITGGTLVADFVPCWDTYNNKYGVFNLTTNTFIGNAATGEDFLHGDVVRSGGSAGGQQVANSLSAGSAAAGFSRAGGTRNATSGCDINNNTAGDDGGGIYVNSGNIFLMDAKVNKNTAINGRGGGVLTEYGNVYVNYWDSENPTTGTNFSVRGETTPSEIKNNYAKLNGGGIITRYGKVLMRGQTHDTTSFIQVSGNKTNNGSGGGIFCLGGSSASTTDEYVRLVNVKIHGNQALNGIGIDSVLMGDGITKVGVSNGCGGGVYLQHGVINMTRCTMGSNTAHVNGGGINNHSGSINIEGCTVNGNKAGEGNTQQGLASGGGIFTVRGDVDIKNHPIGTNLYYRTEIKNNTARNNGGGITTRQGNVTATGEYGSINIGGTEIKKSILIEGNTATQGSGGGVFCLGDVSATPTVYIDFSHVDLIGNKAKDGSQTTEVSLEDGTTVMTVSNGCGGGIYLQRGVIEIENNIIQKNEANMDGGGIYNHGGEIDVDGCLIGGEEADGNIARRSGGGIYTHEGDIDIEDIVLQTDNTLVRLESKVRYNTASENGGGINTHMGTITVNGKQLDDQIEISRNRAKKGGGIYANEGTIIAYNAKINNNTATENGGGINNHSGDISIYGGSLSNNTAETGNGGGAYTHVGDINIKPYNPGNAKLWLNLSPISDGTRIYNNIAQMNGGGLNNHTGLIDLHYAMLQNNTSTLGNGGGIYCQGPHASSTGFTIRLLRSIVNQNKTRGQDGTEDAPTGRGGGIYLHYGRIFAQGSDITFNMANINGGGINNHEGNIRTYGCKIDNNVATTGHGGGIYANKGLIVVGPSGVAGNSVIQRNSAGKDGGGINNREGDIEINGDLILDNEAGQDGGGIYLSLGNITMNGGKIDGNAAVRNGGGVYMGGTKPGNDGFLIQERKADLPVVEIIEIEGITTQSAIVHYHIVNDGNNGTYPDNVTYGVIKGDNTPFESVSAHSIGDIPGCRRDTIKNLQEGTYTVKAWLKNGVVNPYTADTSSTASFTIYGNTPVVFTGSASNITATSANVNGKLVYKGNADVLANAIGIQYSSDKNMNNPQYQYVSSAIENIPAFPEGSYYTVTLNFGQPADNYSTRKFYFRAIATNSANPAQTGYGELDSITLPKNTPNMGTNLVKYEFVTINAGQPDEKPGIKFSFVMPNNVSGNYTNYGFVLSTDDDPELNTDHTINKDNVQIDQNDPKKFTATVPLSLFYDYPSFNYYVRAFATSATNEPDAMDITNYSITAATKFVIPTPEGDPVVRLISISSIAQDSAVVRAIVVIRGNEPITKYGLCWSDDASVHPTAVGNNSHVTVCQADAAPNYHQNPAPVNVGDSTYFTVTMSYLELNTTYYLRVFATNANEPTADDYVYGNDFNFTTLPANPPTVRLTVDNIIHTAATINCTVDNGGNTVTEYGIYWGPAAENSPLYKTVFSGDGLDQTSFTLNLPSDATVANTTVTPEGSPIPTTLTPDTKYKVYAYAINGIGTYTGRELEFTTTFDKPTFSDVTLEAITYNAALSVDGDPSNDNLIHTITVKGSIIDNGSYTPTEYGFVYSANPDPQNLIIQVDGFSLWDQGHQSAAQNTSTVLSDQVNGNKLYLIRPYAKTMSSTGENCFYGDNHVSVLTLPQVNRNLNPSNVTNQSAELSGIINNTDPDWNLREYGFCWVAATTAPSSLTLENADGQVGYGIAQASNTTQSFSFTANGLAPMTKYYWRAYVKNKDYFDEDLPLAYRQANCIAYSTISSSYFTTWQFAVTSEVDPASSGSVAVTSYTYDESATPTPPIPNVSGGNIYCDYQNFPVTLTATPIQGYRFDSWDKVVNNGTTSMGSTNPLEIATQETAHYIAHFIPTVSWTVEGAGTVSGVITGTSTPVSSGDAPSIGTSITLTAEPESGHSFQKWVDANGEEFYDNPYTFTMEGPTILTAVFDSRGGNTAPRPRDIYPAPAREPWDWEDDIFSQLPTKDGNRDGEPAVPTVTTGEPVKDGLTVTCGGNVTNIGSGNVTTYGICWSLYPNPTTANSKTTVTGSFSEAFPISAQTMTEIEPNVTYHVRAYAINAAGTGYGEDKSVTLMFSVITGNVTDITDTTAIVNGTVNTSENITVSEVGVWYSSKGPEYATDQGRTVVGQSGTGFPFSFQVKLEDLTGDSVYYARAYAKFTDGSGKSVKTIYGDSRVFLYNNNRPVITNNTAGDAGGGIYVAYNEQNPARIMFAGGENKTMAGLINNNYATNAGGGIYINELAIMNMKYYCEVNNNHVDEIVHDPAHPDIKKGGGGIYLDGILKVGEKPDDANKHSLMVDHNWAGNNGYEYDASRPDVNNRNNVYLPNDPDPLPESETWDELNGQTITNNGDKQRVITLLSDIAGKYVVIDPSTGQPVINPETNEPQTAYYTKIGISVDHGFRGVIYTVLGGTEEVPYCDEYDEADTHEKWLIDLVPAQGGALNGAFFDDANMYYALHVQNTTNPDNLKRQYDYLYGCWTTAVRVNPNNYLNKFPLPEGLPGHFTEDADGTWHIYTKYGLAWFTSWVNGFNGNIAHPAAKAIIERDMDMREHIWIPIGSSKPSDKYGTEIAFDDGGGAYVGEFNGQGHLITGLQCRYATGIKRYGLFGSVTKSITFTNNQIDDNGTIIPGSADETVTGNGIVKNTFVDEFRYWTFQIGAAEAYAYRIGGIAGEVTGGGKVFASEARGLINIPECVPDQTYVGGLVGIATGTPAAIGDNPSPAKPVLIHSSMAMPEIKGVAKYVGGLVGYLSATDSLLNSFSNSKFTGSPYNNSISVGESTETVYFGGLVGVNDGLVENCYSRLQGNEPTNGTTSIFGWLAGTNNDSIKFSYAPYSNINNGGVYKKTGDKDPKGHGTYTATIRYSDKYGFKHRDHQMANVEGQTNPHITDKTNDTLIGGLMHSLNEWVKTSTNGWNTSNNTNTKGYAVWTRTMASHINDDYPIPMLDTMNKIGNKMFNSVGSKDEIYLLYEDNINDMWAAEGKNFKANNISGSKAAMYLYDVQPIITEATDASPAVYDDVRITGNVNVPLHIHEDIGITQPANAELTARAGVTIKNHRKGTNDYTDDPNWHLFSSAIKNAPIGIRYRTAENGTTMTISNYGSGVYTDLIVGRDSHLHEVWGNRAYFDPPKTQWFQSDTTTNMFTYAPAMVGYFPTDTPYGRWRSWTADNRGFFDLYEYSEIYYHWINYKREGTDEIQDHWHMDRDAGIGENGEIGEHYKIKTYRNDIYMPSGKGYMMALSGESMMMSDGILNTGNVIIGVTNTDIWANLPPHGHGSYNYTILWRSLNLIGNPYQSYLDFDAFANENSRKLATPMYATRDDNDHQFIYYYRGQSENLFTAKQYIHPHQGFFVKVNTSDDVIFNDQMRKGGTSTSLDSPYRGQLNYPLVNLLCFDENGDRDLITVEINRPEAGGGDKMKNLYTGKALLYAHFEGNDYQILFAPVGVNVVPVRFEALEDGMFTMRWNTLHGDFSYLHLIDNLTGEDVDLLTHEEYHFEGKKEDYVSRFKLIFECTGLEENEDENEIEHFAFMFGDELIVNGEGVLQMFDIQGRCLMTARAVGGQSNVSLPKVACGVYLLRLTSDDQVRIQKIVIK